MMDKQKAKDFAIIGHQANWQDMLAMVNSMRKKSYRPLLLSELKTLFPALPPRSLFEIEVVSKYSNKKVYGIYIETFISPDRLLTIGKLRENVEKVKDAARVAMNRRIPISTLGGFTSILLEGNLNHLPKSEYTAFTTGNTLTAGLIVEGVHKACVLLDKNPSKCNLLIIGATGDLGSICAKYFKSMFKDVMLVARNWARLKTFAQSLKSSNVSTAAEDFTPQADVIISVASSTELGLSDLKDNVLIADAGYPKNILAEKVPHSAHIFHAGMGKVSAGYSFIPPGYENAYSFPLKNIAHGCVLEGAVLALENRNESFSTGRGKISVEKMEEILAIGKKHGIGLAPFYNENGLWETEITRTYGE